MSLIRAASSAAAAANSAVVRLLGLFLRAKPAIAGVSRPPGQPDGWRAQAACQSTRRSYRRSSIAFHGCSPGCVRIIRTRGWRSSCRDSKKPPTSVNEAKAVIEAEYPSRLPSTRRWPKAAADLIESPGCGPRSMNPVTLSLAVSPHHSLRPATDRRGGRLGTLEDQHAHCLSVNRGDVLDAAAAAPPQLCGSGMAQVSVRGLGGRGSERLRAEASRLRRPTRGRVVLRAASSFLPAQSSAPILFGLSLQICQASRARRRPAANERDPVCLED